MHKLIPLLGLATLAFASGPKEIPLWDKGAPGSEGVENKEHSVPGPDGEPRIREVSRPTLTVHLPPKEKATGAAVIIAPGGGYVHLAIAKEGHDVAKWLNSIGIAGIVLKYRVASDARENRERQTGFARADGLRAIELARKNAAAWNINPNRVAIMGFSAGGNLVANVGLSNDGASRPNLLMMIYPGAPRTMEFSRETPPSFLVHADDDDTAPSLGSIRIYEALKKAGVPAELHIFAKGKHGFGMRPTNSPTDGWTIRLKEWLDLQGWTKR